MSNQTPEKQRQRSLSKSTKGGNNNKVFISRIDPSLAKQDVLSKLQVLLEKIGKDPKIQIKKSYDNSYYFAFVEMEDSAAALSAIKTLNNHEINGKKISVMYQRGDPRNSRMNYNRNFNAQKPRKVEANTDINRKNLNQREVQRNKNENSKKHQSPERKKSRYASQSQYQDNKYSHKKYQPKERRDKEKVREKTERKKNESQDKKYSSRKNHEKDDKYSKNLEYKKHDSDHRRRNHSNQVRRYEEESYGKGHSRSRPTARHPERKEARRSKERKNKKREEYYQPQKSSSRSNTKVPKKTVKKEKRHRRERERESSSSYRKYKN